MQEVHESEVVDEWPVVGVVKVPSLLGLPVDRLELGHRGGHVEVAHGPLDGDEVRQEAGGSALPLVVGRGRRRSGSLCLQ